MGAIKRYIDFEKVVMAKRRAEAKRKKDKLKAYSTLKRKAKLKALPNKARKKFNSKAYLKAIDSPYKL